MWAQVTCVLLFGYLALNRTFSYLGIPPWKVFVGEVMLASFLLLGPKVGPNSWCRFTMKLPYLREFWIWFALFLTYGIVQVVNGILNGSQPITAIRDLAFNYYPLFFLLGLWMGVTRYDLLPRVIRAFAWFNGIYGILYIFFLSRVPWFLPGVSDEVTPVSIFGQPIYSFVAILGLLAYEKSMKSTWYLLLLNGFVLLGMQFRTEWVACAIGILAWGIVNHKGKQMLQASAVLAFLFVLLYAGNVKFASPEGRTEEDFSARQITDRATAPFHADLSDESVASGSAGTDSQEATFVFRTVWWLAIWDSSLQDLRTALLGHGYGFPLGDLVPYLKGQFIRTPHNAFFYALGYTGWIGVFLFAVFEWQIVRLLWRSKQMTGETFGVALWVAVAVFAMFFPLGETPYGAIPFYLMLGWTAGPGVLKSLPVRHWNLPGVHNYAQGQSGACPA